MPKRFYTLQPRKNAIIVWEPGQVATLWNNPKIYTAHTFARLCLIEEPIYVPWRVVEILSQHVDLDVATDEVTWPLNMKPTT